MRQEPSTDTCGHLWTGARSTTDSERWPTSRPRPISRGPCHAPAGMANLGSGFDCFAAALSLKLRAELFEGDEPGIVLNAHGEGTPGPDADPEENLLIRAFREGLRAAHGPAGGAGSW